MKYVPSLRSAMWFILASICRQIQIKNSIALPRFAWPCGSFWTQYSIKFREKFRELCLASLGHVVYFGFNLPSNSEQNCESSASLRSVMWFLLDSITRQIQRKIAKALPRFAGPCGSFWTQSPVAFRAKIRSSASLRLVMWFISFSISRGIQSKILRAMPRFARLCIFCFNLLLYSCIFSRRIQSKILRAVPRFVRLCIFLF